MKVEWNVCLAEEEDSSGRQEDNNNVHLTDEGRGNVPTRGGVRYNGNIRTDRSGITTYKRRRGYEWF